ncbi:MAG: hypothetical protein ACFFD2_10265 [Promethearchaeota archaeon]
MNEIERLEVVKSLLNDFFSVSPVKCSKFVGDRACVTCEELDNCTSIEIKRENYENLKLLVAGNSAMLSIKFFFKSDIEQFVMAKLFHSLQQRQELPIIKAEEGFSLTFYTKYGQINPKEQQFAAIIKVLDLLSENPWIETKMLINKWINNILDKLNLQIMAEISKVTLKTTPKIERSKIFKPKYEISDERTLSIGREKAVEDALHPKTQEDLEQYIPETPSAPPRLPIKPRSQEVSGQETTVPITTISPLDSHKPIEKTETTSIILDKPIKDSKIPKQSFFITAKERENEFASWPPYIKRKMAGEKEEKTIIIPSVIEAPKKISPKKSIDAKSQIPHKDKFELRIFEKKKAKEHPLPPMPKKDSFKILTYLEKLVKSDYEMRKIAIRFEEGHNKIKEMMFYTDFLFEMNKVANILRKSEPRLTLNEHTRKDLLRKISKWKVSLERKKRK